MRALVCMLVLAAAASPPVDAEPVAARYRETWRSAAASVESALVLVRDADRVELRHEATGIVERWERDARGRLFYLRASPARRKAIEFQSADFAGSNVPSDWLTIRSIVDPGVLQRLDTVGEHAVLDRAATVYRGTLDGATVEIAWLAEDVLPATLASRRADVNTELRLEALWHGAEAVAQFTPAPALDACVVIDYADIGDLAPDPDIDRLLGAARADVHRH